MIQRILETENLQKACDFLQQKNDSCGIDGMRLSELQDYLSNNEANLRKTILDGKYNPGLIQEVNIINRNGKIRTIAKLTSVDRLILRAIYHVMYDAFSPLFSKYSYAYQENKSISDAVRQTVSYIEEGYCYVVDVDIDSYFDNISHYKLQKILKENGLDNETNNLIYQFLNCKIIRDFEIIQKEKGLVQGSPLSPLLSNLYLHEADMFFEKKDFRFCRYADDVRLFAKTVEDGLEIYSQVKEFLETELMLTLNTQKSGVFYAFEKKYLGYQFSSFPNGKVEIKKESRSSKISIYDWKSSALQKLGGEYHLMGDGILTQKDYNLLFENPEKKMYIPVNSTDCLNFYGDITLSSGFFKFISNNNIQLNFFDKYSDYLGTFIPRKLSVSASLTMHQALCYESEEKRLEIAKQFAVAAAHNIRENVKYYNRHNKVELFDHTINRITEMMQDEKICGSVSELMLIEARIRGEYYKCLNDILPYDDFHFIKRTKRPPEDSINSLISFGNTILYRRVAKEIYKSRLDIRIGFLHTANRRYESLNLDISEIFRPIIVDRVIFTLINKHMINEKTHFETFDNGAVYLNRAGKKLFITEFEKKMLGRIKQSNGIKISYGELIKSEIQKLTRYFEKGETYKAYKYFL